MALEDYAADSVTCPVETMFSGGSQNRADPRPARFCEPPLNVPFSFCTYARILVTWLQVFFSPSRVWSI
jgi:hypothetical protein